MPEVSTRNEAFTVTALALHAELLKGNLMPQFVPQQNTLDVRRWRQSELWFLLTAAPAERQGGHKDSAVRLTAVDIVLYSFILFTLHVVDVV